MSHDHRPDPKAFFEGTASIFHYDLYSQALAKIERGLEKDLADVSEMLARGAGSRERLVPQQVL